MSSGANEAMEHSSPVPVVLTAQPQEKMEGGESDQEREGDVELPETLEGSTPTSSVSEISPGLSRFLLHISGTSPNSSSAPFVENCAYSLHTRSYWFLLFIAIARLNHCRNFFDHCFSELRSSEWQCTEHRAPSTQLPSEFVWEYDQEKYAQDRRGRRS